MENDGAEVQQPNGEEPKEEQHILHTRWFLVDERAYTLSDWDIERHNKAYLASISGDYFHHLAHFYGDQLSGDGARYAALGLRAAYSQALETLLALICALVQAPNCAIGWVLNYKDKDLRSVVGKIHEGKELKTLLKIDSITWDSLADKFILIATGDKEQDERIRKHFANLWARLAEDFLNDVVKKEYNSIKHSLRVALMPGFTMRIGPVTQPDAPPLPDDAYFVVKSDFGTHFYVAEAVDNGLTKDNAKSFRLREQIVNWHPGKYLTLLQLITSSIDNVANALRHFNHAPVIDPAAKWPSDESFFDAAWTEYNYSIGEIAITPVNDEAARAIPCTPKASVIARYHTANANYVPPEQGSTGNIDESGHVSRDAE